MSIENTFDIVIGLEIHAELKTNTKVFCACKNSFGDKPNTNTCPVCTGMPGALPLLNRKAVEFAIKAGLCFGSEISRYSVFERKNYFYPDLSKAYQISQLEFPLCVGGNVFCSKNSKIRLNRIHLEEDAGKLVHLGKKEGTLIDYNRGGTPLIEIVTEPDIKNKEEAVYALKSIRESLIFQGIADCKMEEGGLRCDVNLSLKPKGATKLGTRTEMKNLNSFKSVERAIEYETMRQAEVLAGGGKIVQETRKWDDSKGKSLSMRSKEEAEDYRYFKDPDILPLKITEEDILKIKKSMTLLPEERREKYQNEFSLPLYDAEILTSEKYISDYFEKCVSILNLPKKISNWIMVDLLKIMKETEGETFPISEAHLTEIISLVENKKLTKAVGLDLLNLVIATKEDPIELAQKHKLFTGITKEQIKEILEKFKIENPKAVSDYIVTPDKVTGFIIGYVMKNTAGKANSEDVKEMISKVF